MKLAALASSQNLIQFNNNNKIIIIIIIIMYIYHALINALSAHMIHINLKIYDILYTCRA